MKVMLHAPIGQSYHISTKDTVSIRNLVQKICDTLSVRFEDVVEISEDRLGKDQAYLLNSDKIRSTLNWSDQIDLDAGLEDTQKWLDNNLDILREQPAVYVHKP
jgi:dTDP-glucose 4,6-dehydratase